MTQYGQLMAGGGSSAAPGPLAARRLVPPLAAFFAVAALVDRPEPWRAAVLLVPPVLFGWWYVRPAVMPVLALAVPVSVGVAVWDGGMEPSLFIVSLLTLTAAAWEHRRPLAAAIVVVGLLTPVVPAVLSQRADITWPLWDLGILFPTVLGLSIRRLEQLTGELTAARQELAERAVLDERRRIGRDVHDLVGHGLAAVVLQVTSARHVLRRDLDAADEALCAAEDAGRRSLQEVRRTVDLWAAAQDPDGSPTATLTQMNGLLDTYRAAGLRVDFHASGDWARVPQGSAVSVYRIAQQALANAAQHAPAARTVVHLQVGANEVSLTVDSIGVCARRHGGRSGQGLASMRERARLAGGQLQAGPVENGWTVRCVLPLDSGDTSPPTGARSADVAR